MILRLIKGICGYWSYLSVPGATKSLAEKLEVIDSVEAKIDHLWTSEPDAGMGDIQQAIFIVAEE